MFSTQILNSTLQYMQYTQGIYYNYCKKRTEVYESKLSDTVFFALYSCSLLMLITCSRSLCH